MSMTAWPANSISELRGNATATVFVYDDKVNYIGDKNYFLEEICPFGTSLSRFD
jgi:hypothetical protein